MNGPAPYDVVVSLAGHDRGKFYMVVGTREDRLLLCNGKNRRLEAPKCKSPKHVRVAAPGSVPPVSDSELRKTLALAERSSAAKEGIHHGER